ncbi:MAG: efflux RND transporter periplasmic adaptor subunit [Alphaproteobacteria bacterium]|nr:efflux RND transporter periplasmic adaptor subunit [Alphaproteobacteria bacterium]
MIINILKTALTLSILFAAGAMSYYFIANPAKTERKEHETPKVFVRVQPVILGSHEIKIDILGRVAPARSTELKARISGEVVETSNSFVPGGFFEKGEVILTIDPTDYELDLKMQQAAVKQAEAALNIELGRQQIAQNELKIIEESTGQKIQNNDLALRKPQLAQIKADIEAARAQLNQAELNLERTTIRAPFNALIVTRDTNLGNVVSTQDILATIVDTDTFWVLGEIAVQDLRFLDVPKTIEDSGSKAEIILGDERGTRIGKILKVSGTLGEQSRLAEVIVEVDDPLLLKTEDATKSPLVLRDFVRMHLIGKMLRNTAKIRPSLLRRDNTVWLERNGKLFIQPVTIIYQDREFMYVTSGLENGDRIITSNIVTPMNGMDISVKEDTAP